MDSDFKLSDTQQAALQRLGVILLYLHGSIASGTAGKESDVDIAVLFDRAPEDSIRATTTILQIMNGLFSGRELDIAILNEASPLLKQLVASQGRLLYARSPDEALQFELYAMHEYEYSRHVVRLGQELLLKHTSI